MTMTNDPTQELTGKPISKLEKGQKVGMDLQLYAGRVMPTTFGQVVEFSQMMCKGGLAIPKHLRDNPGTCLRVVQQSIAWEMDPWAVASKTYSVNDQLAFEAQLVSAVIRKWAPIKERVIPYVFTGEGGELQCSIVVHHASTGEEIPYTSPKKKDIQPQNSPLWKTDPQQQLAYYSIRALARRHFPDILMGVYDREEVLAMKDITPPVPVENYLNEGEAPNMVAGQITQEEAPVMVGEIIIPEKTAEKVLAETPDHDPVTGEIYERGDKYKPGDEVQIIPPETIAKNLLTHIKGETDAVILQEWQNQNHVTINGLPAALASEVRKALSDRHVELEPL
jgi:hypothetical protein